MNKDIKHSIDFITTKTGGKSGYTTPKNYFDEVEDAFFIKLTEQKLPKENGFEVSNDYFKELEDTILAKVALENKTAIKVISLKERILRFAPLAAAASVLLFIGINYYTTQDSIVNLNDITEAEIENWYESSYQNINNEELAMALESDTFNESDFIIATNANDLEDYLQNVDTSLLDETP